MKIGILTLPLNRNYGGILQAFALHSYLTSLGHSVYLIDRRIPREEISFRDKLSDFLYKYVIDSKTILFAKTSIVPRTEPIYNDSDLKNAVENLDAVIVGSDQVWRLAYSGPIALNFFLDFIKNDKTKKISYAASFGLETWEESKEITEKISKLLRRFDSISVREDMAVSLCKEVFKVECTQNLDPTLLLDSRDYIRLIEGDNSVGLNKLLTTYILDASREKTEIIEKIAKHKGLVPRSINVEEKFTLKKFWRIYKCVYPDVSNWISGFSNAEFVVTDSFHGVVFSIIFKKQFIAIGNIERGIARFKSVLNLFGLNDRIIFKYSDLSDELLSKVISYDEVYDILNAKRIESSVYFQNSLT